jgi:hypothetical protein
MKSLLGIISILSLVACKKEDVNKDRMLQKIEFKNIHWDNAGQPWDSDGTGPDVYMKFGPSDSISNSTTEKTNVTQSDFPYSNTLPTEVRLTNAEWTFQVFDADDGNDQLMSFWKFNPFEQEENPIHLTGNNGKTWDINLHYEK